MKKIFIFISLSFVFLTCNSCSEMFDCIASTKPELEYRILLEGYQGYLYEDFVTASVKNSSNDNSFYYYFSIDGEIPPGIDYYEEGRDLVFYGTPNRSGTYDFKVTVKIEYPESYDPEAGFWEDDNRICFGNDTVSENYSITIY